MILAAVLTLSISSQVDLNALQSRADRSAPTQPGVTCGIKVVGYRITGKPGQEFRYGRWSLTIPPEGYVELIAFPHIKKYSFAGREHTLEEGPLDGFSFRWIALPAPRIAGASK